MIATSFLLAITLSAFAANSILCRLALGSDLIDAVSFTSVRLMSGAMMLGLVLIMRGKHVRPGAALDPVAGLALFAYAICFSLAYVALDAGTGAIILFPAVQLTMIGVGFWRGERPPAKVWLGAALALGGLIYLLAPGVTAPPSGAAALMLFAGTAWGVYSLRGVGKSDPVAATAWNFIAATPMTLLLSLVTVGASHVTSAGVGWAVLSGAITSGLGYVIWYQALPRLSATTAAIVQLCVPALAGFGGVALLGEPFSFRLGIASAVILGGVTLVVAARKRKR